MSSLVPQRPCQPPVDTPLQCPAFPSLCEAPSPRWRRSAGRVIQWPQRSHFTASSPIPIAHNSPGSIWHVVSSILQAAVTSHYKPATQNKYMLIITWFWRLGVSHRSHWTKIKVSAGLHSFWRLWGQPLPASEAAHPPQFIAPSASSKPAAAG